VRRSCPESSFLAAITAAGSGMTCVASHCGGGPALVTSTLVARSVLDCPQVINTYISLLQQRHDRRITAAKAAGDEPPLPCKLFNSFFFTKLTEGPDRYNYKNVRRWTRKVRLCAAWRCCMARFPNSAGVASSTFLRWIRLCSRSTLEGYGTH